MRVKPAALVCPHCAAPVAPGFAVRWSSRGTPAPCGACQKLSHVLASTSSGIAGAGCVLSTLTVTAAMVMESWLVLVPGLALAVAHNLWAWRRVELFPISAEAARTAIQVNWWLLGAAAFLKIFSS